MSQTRRTRQLVGLLWAAAAATALADPVRFDIPAEPAAQALLDFSKSAHVDVLFDYGALSKVPTHGLHETQDPANALSRLLEGTGFSARINPNGGFVVAKSPKPPGALEGTLVDHSGAPAKGVRVAIPELLRSEMTDEKGRFHFGDVAPGTYSLFTAGGGYQPDIEDKVVVESSRTLHLQVPPLKPLGSPSLLETIFVNGLTDANAPDNSRDTQRLAAGDVDLPRSVNDPLPYEIYDKDLIAKSGAVSLDQFLRREVLQGSATTQPPDQNGNTLIYEGGSSNLNMRGFSPADTVVLVNGRPLPAIVDAVKAGSGFEPPNVNLFPLSMVERVEVLPVSASALYEGNPVGGVINIVLRPDIEDTELTATYSNATHGLNAPDSSIALVHGESLLDGRLTYRIDLSASQSTPATEGELGYIKALRIRQNPAPYSAWGATPNVYATDHATGLFGPGSAWFGIVSAGSNGSTPFASVAANQGQTNASLFQTPPGDGNSPYDANYAYGHRRKTTTYYLSTDYELFPSLQIGAEGLFSKTLVSGGYDLTDETLSLPATSAFNPFGTDVKVNVLESPEFLGKDYDQARITLASATLSAVLKLPDFWRVTFDGQATRSLTDYRGVANYDGNNWQLLTTEGLYNPFRDTQLFPSQAFQSGVVEIYGNHINDFVTMGDYRSLSLTFRVSNQAIPLPTGIAVVNGGVDYHRDQLDTFPGNEIYGDGTPVTTYKAYTGRTLSEVSTFAEFQVPLLPKAVLPRLLKGVEADVAGRYTFANTALGTSFAPTAGLKVDLVGGLSLRASVATTNRFGAAYLSRENQIAGPSSGGTGNTSAPNLTTIIDPLRGNSSYGTNASLDLDPQLHLEGDVTQSAGLIFERGDERRLRVSVDFTDTLTENKEAYLGAQDVVNLEQYFPSRIVRSAPSPGDPYAVGPITSILMGNINSGKVHSQDWTSSVEYAWRHVWGGTLDLHANWVHLQSYKVKHILVSPYIDELGNPDIGTVDPLLRNRINYGISWAGPRFEAGVDAQYFGPHNVPFVEWGDQGGRSVESFRQYDTFLKADLLKLAGLAPRRFGLSAEVRVNNILASRPPVDVDSETSAGVDSFTDWRGRNYSLSITATY